MNNSNKISILLLLSAFCLVIILGLHLSDKHLSTEVAGEGKINHKRASEGHYGFDITVCGQDCYLEVDSNTYLNHEQWDKLCVVYSQGIFTGTIYLKNICK